MRSRSGSSEADLEGDAGNEKGPQRFCAGTADTRTSSVSFCEKTRPASSGRDRMMGGERRSKDRTDRIQEARLARTDGESPAQSCTSEPFVKRIAVTTESSVASGRLYGHEAEKGC